MAKLQTFLLLTITISTFLMPTSAVTLGDSKEDCRTFIDDLFPKLEHITQPETQFEIVNTLNAVT